MRGRGTNRPGAEPAIVRAGLPGRVEEGLADRDRSRNEANGQPVGKLGRIAARRDGPWRPCETKPIPARVRSRNEPNRPGRPANRSQPASWVNRREESGQERRDRTNPMERWAISKTT